MKIVAITKKGIEYVYSVRTAHFVSERSANKICDVLNEYRFKIKGDEVWYVYDVDRYDTAYDYAMMQKFSVRKGIVKRHGEFSFER